jgi:hypothetical protein
MIVDYLIRILFASSLIFLLISAGLLIMHYVIIATILLGTILIVEDKWKSH